MATYNVVVQIFLNHFNSDFTLYQIMLMNMKQRKIKIQLLLKNLKPKKRFELQHT